MTQLFSGKMSVQGTVKYPPYSNTEQFLSNSIL